MASKAQKQVLDFRADKGFKSDGESNEIIRIASNGTYKANLSNALNPIRTHLDFEVEDGKVVDINCKVPIGKRIRENLKNRGINDPNEGKAKPRFRTIIDCYFSGTSFLMRDLAFGKQNVNFSKGADNSKVQRLSDIEEWAKKLYIFLADKFGEENIVIFVVQLDDATPHAHCQILPITKENKFSYRKIMVGEINSKIAYRDNMIKLQKELFDSVYEEFGFTQTSKRRTIDKDNNNATTFEKGITSNLTFKELNRIYTY